MDKMDFHQGSIMKRMAVEILAIRLVMGLACLSVLPPKAAAQIFGFVNITLQPGLNLIGWPLRIAGDNTISTLLAERPSGASQVPEGTIVYRIVQGNFTTNVFEKGAWERPDEVIEEGEGIFIRNPASEAVRLAFSGQVREGDLTNAIPQGLAIRSSLWLLGGRITQDLGFELSAFDNIYLLADGVLEVFTYLPNGAWQPNEPTLRQGEAFVVNASQSTNWITHFQPE
jgi:hypothetical protein